MASLAVLATMATMGTGPSVTTQFGDVHGAMGEAGVAIYKGIPLRQRVIFSRYCDCCATLSLFDSAPVVHGARNCA